MILSCSNICKSFGSDDIIKNASFHIEDHEKAAIVGINGAGKSTLLKIIVGELAPDSGETLLQAAELNEQVKDAMEDIVELDSISQAELNTDYNFTDTQTKRYRYQAVYDLVFF